MVRGTKKLRLIIAASLVLILIFFAAKVSSEVESFDEVTLSIARQPVVGLIYIAEDQGYFKDERLKIKYRDFTFGVDALKDMVSGNSQLATVFESPVVDAAYREDPIKILTSLHQSSRFTYLLASSSGTIKNVADIKAKKIGLTRGTNAEFFLYSLLNSNAMTVIDITLVDIKEKDLLNALANRRVDAVIIWELPLFESKKVYQSKGYITISSPIYEEISLLVTRNDYLKSHPETINKFVRALVRAEDYYHREPEKSLVIIQSTLSNDSPESVANSLSVADLTLKLDHKLLRTLSWTSTWQKEVGAKVSPAPNFYEYIYSSALLKAKPKGVTIIE